MGKATIMPIDLRLKDSRNIFTRKRTFKLAKIYSKGVEMLCNVMKFLKLFTKNTELKS